MWQPVSEEQLIGINVGAYQIAAKTDRMAIGALGWLYRTTAAVPSPHGPQISVSTTFVPA